MARKDWYKRFPGLKRPSLKSIDAQFSSGKPGRDERKEWNYWHKGYKEEDYFKAYITEVKNIPNCDADALLRYWKIQQDRASFIRLIRAHLKIVPKIAYRIADEYGFKPSYNVVRDRKKARQGYEAVVADLIGAGNEGLLNAVRRFRLDAGASFATAASCSVEKEIRAEARRLRQAVEVPEDKSLPWYKSLTAYDEDANEYEGETDVAVGGFAVSAYQLADSALDADPADATIGGPDFTQSIRDFICLADLERAANSIKDKRERDIFRAHYIHGKTLKTIASKYGTIGFRQVSKIARAGRDKILKTDFVIETVNWRALLFQPRWTSVSDLLSIKLWLLAIERCNDVDLIHTRGRRARLWIPGDERNGLRDGIWLATANRLGLWRLAEFEREDINEPWWNRKWIAELKIAEKKERWRKRKSDAPGLWDLLTPFYHPPEAEAERIVPVYSVTPPWLGPVIPAIWMTRSTYPARIHVAAPSPKPAWVRPSSSYRLWPDLVQRKRHLKPSKELSDRYSRPSYYVAGWRALWKDKLDLHDWRIKYQRERQEEFLNTHAQQKEAA